MEVPDIDVASNKFVYLLIVLLLSARTFLLNLDEAAIQGYDEGLYAVGAINILDGHWLVHKHTLASGAGQYIPHLSKPPFVPWIQSVSMLMFGETAFAARLPSAVAGVLVAIVVLYIGSEFVDLRVGLFAAFIFVTTPQVFTGTNTFRQATIDGILVLFGTLFILFTWLSVYRDTRYFYVIALLAPLLVLTKSVQAGIFILAVLPIVALNLGKIMSREFVVAVSTTSIIVGSWLVPMFFQFGDIFVQRFFLNQLFERTTGGLAITGGALFDFMKYPYIQNIFSLWDPWIWFFLPGIIILPLIHQRGRDDWVLLSVWSSVSVFVFFVFTGNHPHYILPMYTTGAIVVGALARDAMKNYRPAQVGIVVGLAGVILFSPRSPSPWSFPWNGLWGNKPGDVILISLLIGICILVVFHAQLTRQFRSILTEEWFEDVKPATIVILILTFGFIISSPAVIQHQGATERQQLALEAETEIPNSATIYFGESFRLHGKYLTVEFYTKNDFKGVPVERLNTDEQIQYAIIFPQTGELDRSYRIISGMDTTSQNESVKIVEFT